MGLGTLIATSTACVLLAIPTTTEPCFTASAAYSTWNILPCGELESVGRPSSVERPHVKLQLQSLAVLLEVGGRRDVEMHAAYNVTESLS